MESGSGRKIRTTLFTHLPEIAERWCARHFDRARLVNWQITSGTNCEDLAWLQKHYIEPVLRLLGEYVGTAKDRYLAVYLDERLRYAPHRRDRLKRAEFFKELLPEDEADLLAPFEEGSLEHAALRALLTQIHAPLLDTGEKGRLEVLALGDRRLNEVRIFLTQKCRMYGVEAQMCSLSLSATQNTKFEPTAAISYLATNKVDAVAISFSTLGEGQSFSNLLQEYPQLTSTEIDSRIKQIVHSVRQYLLALRERTHVPLLVHNVCGLPLSRVRKYIPLLAAIPNGKEKILSRINREIDQAVRDTPNCILIDERSICCQYGIRSLAKSTLPWWLRNDAFFHASALGEKLAEAYAHVLGKIGRRVDVAAES